MPGGNNVFKNHRSLPAAATIAIASLCLVGAGTAGAVAGRLIDSDDIARNGVEKRNLAPDSVNWRKVLSDKTKQRIKSFAGEDGADGADGADGLDGAEGPAGPAGKDGARGPAGPMGQQGPAGPAGPAGADGSTLVATQAFGGEWLGEVPALGGPRQVAPYGGDGITLTEPGTYLVTARVLGSLDTMSGSFGMMMSYVGHPEALDSEADFFADSGLCFGYVVPFCEVTYPVSIAPGETLPLAVLAMSAPESEGAGIPPVAKVTVFKMDDDIADNSAYDELLEGLLADPCPESECPSISPERFLDQLSQAVPGRR